MSPNIYPVAIVKNILIPCSVDGRIWYITKIVKIDRTSPMKSIPYIFIKSKLRPWKITLTPLLNV